LIDVCAELAQFEAAERIEPAYACVQLVPNTVNRQPINAQVYSGEHVPSIDRSDDSSTGHLTAGTSALECSSHQPTAIDVHVCQSIRPHSTSGKPRYVIEQIPEHLILYTDERYLDEDDDDDDERRFVRSGSEDESNVSTSDDDEEDGTSEADLDAMCTTPLEEASTEKGWHSSEMQRPLDDTLQLVQHMIGKQLECTLTVTRGEDEQAEHKGLNAMTDITSMGLMTVDELLVSCTEAQLVEVKRR